MLTQLFPDLEKLNLYLLEETSKGFSPNQKALLQSKWPQIREIASQNAGYRTWGSHLLKLAETKLDILREAFKNTVRSVEGESLNLAQIIAQAHPELIGLRFLLDQNLPLTDLPLNKESAKAILLEYDSNLVAQHREHFQKVFKVLSSLDVWSKRDPLVAQMLVGHLISLLPYFDFENGAQVSLLKHLQGEWKLLDYQIEHIPLIPKKIIAYGLVPLSEPKATPLLIFRGTPYPAAAGFFDAIWSDLHPTKSIGEDIFRKGKPSLDQWMLGKSKVECYGVSLGGALTYHAGNAYGDKIEVHAYMAPGLVPMKGGLSQIRGRVFFHHNDFVNLIGFHPESDYFDIFSVLTATDRDFIRAHATPSGIEPTLVLKIDPRHENRTWSRYIFNILKIVVSSVLWVTLLPINLAIKTLEKIESFWKKPTQNS